MDYSDVPDQFRQKERKTEKTYGHLLAIDRTALCFLAGLRKYPELKRETADYADVADGCREGSTVR
jgi:hypothetical protein